MRANYLAKLGIMGGLLLAGFSVQAEEQVLCIATKNILVYQADIKTVVFSGDRFETVAPFQGWGTNMKDVIIGGKKVTFVRAQFTDREEEDADAGNDIGWLKLSDIKPKSQCAGYVAPKDTDTSDGKDEPETTAGSDITGLTDKACCRFPLATSAQADYRTGMRRFGYGRPGGRKHAAADLYHRNLEPVYAVADGVILRDRESFYGGTTATEIKHSGGFVARYGEMAFNAQKKIAGLGRGVKVKAGDLIGYIKATKKTTGGYSHPMLHFELYTGKLTGDLSLKNSKSAYKRRADLLNPTPYLQKWEGNKG